MLGNGSLVDSEAPGDRLLAQAPEIVKLEAFSLAGCKVLVHRFPDLPHPGMVMVPGPLKTPPKKCNQNIPYFSNFFTW